MEILLFIIWIISLIWAISIFIDHLSGVNPLRLFIVFCPIVNTIFCIKYTDWKNIQLFDE